MGERITVADVAADTQQLKADNEAAHERLAAEAAAAEKRLLERVDGIEPRVAALEADAARIEPLDLGELLVELQRVESGLSEPGVIILRPEAALEAVRGAVAVVRYLDAVWAAEDALEAAQNNLPTAKLSPSDAVRAAHRKGSIAGLKRLFFPEVTFTALGDDLKPTGDPIQVQATIEFGDQPQADASLDG